MTADDPSEQRAARHIDGLTLQWSPLYNRAWDTNPAAYLQAELVGWGRSKRLARASDPPRGFVAYLGVQHSDPSRWGRLGEPRTVFFLSLLVGGRTITLRTYATFAEAWDALTAFYQWLLTQPGATRE